MHGAHARCAGPAARHVQTGQATVPPAVAERTIEGDGGRTPCPTAEAIHCRERPADRLRAARQHALLVAAVVGIPPIRTPEPTTVDLAARESHALPA
jgi:hypothetical protein